MRSLSLPSRHVAAIDGRGIVSVEEEPVPQPGAGEVLIEVYASLISPGTELGGVKARREHPDPSAPKRPFGYSNAGTVLDKGSECEAIAIGQRMACMGAGYALHATHARVPKNLCVPMPERMRGLPGANAYEKASFNHLAATALQAIRRAELQLGEHVVVVGLGLVGQLCAQLARLSGAHIMGVDRFPLRLDIARATGIEAAVLADEGDLVHIAAEFTRGYGMDCAILCFGGEATEAFKTTVQMMKISPDTHRMGRIVIVGGAHISHGFAAALGNLDVRSSARTGPGYHDEVWEHGQDYPPVFMPWTTRRNVEEVLRLIAEERLLVDPLITHRVPLRQAPEACEQLIQHPERALGVVLLPEKDTR